MTRLWEPGPAQAWTEAYPIGNGRLGAMYFGGVGEDRLQLNDATCWSGSSHDGAAHLPANGPALLATARSALATGDLGSAEEAVQSLQSGFSQAYQPLIDLVLIDESDREASYGRRVLDLSDAIAFHSWHLPDGTARQEAWASHPAQAIALRRTLPTASNIRLRITSPHPTLNVTPRDGGVEASVRMPASVIPGRGGHPDRVDYEGTAMTAGVAVRVTTDGAIAQDGPDLTIDGARNLFLVVTSESGEAGGATELIEQAWHRAGAVHERGVEAVRAEHVADHHHLFDRVGLELGPQPEAPTSQRITAHGAGEHDPALVALAFDYGRYLMIAGSRPGSLPLTLQGLWNESVKPPWSSNYTVNINTEMNYWPAHTANLSECAEPLLGWLDLVAERGAVLARDLYDLPGWVLHHNSDRWGFAGPVGAGEDSPSWSFWPMGGVWLTGQLLEQAEFGVADRWRERVWPIAAGAAEFALGWIQHDDAGRVMTSPATSPENLYLAGDGTARAVSTSTTCDIELLRTFFSGLTQTFGGWEGLDGGSHALLRRCEHALADLPATRILPDGRIAEWAGDPVEEDPHHRHQSHLVGLFPGRSITASDPDLEEAARASLLARGPDATGWSLAWRIALWARLRDAEAVSAAIGMFLRSGEGVADYSTTGGGVYPNLFCSHPPFQIDGNFGFTAAVAESVVQSHERDEQGRVIVRVLPACPWPSGSARGLRARGGVTVDLAWRGGTLRALALRADHDVELRLLGTEPASPDGDRGTIVNLTAGRAWHLNR